MLVSSCSEVVNSTNIGPSEAGRKVLRIQVGVGKRFGDVLSISESSYTENILLSIDAETNTMELL